MSEKLWTKDFMLITLVNFLMYIIHYSLIVTITVFTIEEYQASEGMGGLAAGIFIIGMLFGRLYAGKYIDQWQPKYILMIGLIASIATISLYFTIHSLAILMIVRFLHGIAFGVSSTSTGAIASKIVPEPRKGEGIGYYALSTTVASAIGPFVGILINQQLGFGMNFTFCLVIITVALILGFTTRKITVAAPETEEYQQESKGLDKYVQREALPIALVSVFFGAAYASVLSLFYMLADLGAGFSPFLLGMLIPLLGYRNLYLVMGLLIIATTALYYVLHGKKARQGKMVKQEGI